MSRQLPLHRSHHYPTLIRRWREIARESGLTICRFATHDGFPIYVLENRRPPADGPAIYLSAGIHGDEPAGTEGLLAWAGKNPDTLRRARFTIFPCLNPWGLTNNTRTDASGIDLNRQFHHPDHSLFRILKEFIGKRHFHLALTLHEDFDAQGTYLYELNGNRLPYSPLLLAAARHIIPADPRSKIDGRKLTEPGYLHKSVARRKLPEGPEAIYLARNHVDLCFTVETPSEFSLDRRIRAQRTIVEAAIQIVLQKD